MSFRRFADPITQTCRKQSFNPSSPTKLNELTWPAALNRLTPGHIKRTATDFMKEWEKSLSPPPAERTAALGADEERSA